MPEGAPCCREAGTEMGQQGIGGAAGMLKASPRHCDQCDASVAGRKVGKLSSCQRETKDCCLVDTVGDGEW